MSTASLRTLGGLRRLRIPARAFSTAPRRPEAAKAPVAEGSEAEKVSLRQQAPNRVEKWAKGQRDRASAMTGPRFEQTDFTKQVGFFLPR